MEKQANYLAQVFENQSKTETAAKIDRFEPILIKAGIGKADLLALVVYVGDEEELESAISESAKTAKYEYSIGRRVDRQVSLEDLVLEVAPHHINWKQKREQGDLIETAEHEQGHSYMAKLLGWKVEEISVVRHGPVLGYTRTVPPNKPQDTTTFEMIVICFGGKAAEKICGISDHRGCGSDMGKARHLANILSWQSEGRVSADTYLNIAEAMALSGVSSNIQNIRKDAGILADKKVAA